MALTVLEDDKKSTWFAQLEHQWVWLNCRFLKTEAATNRTGDIPIMDSTLPGTSCPRPTWNDPIPLPPIRDGYFVSSIVLSGRTDERLELTPLVTFQPIAACRTTKKKVSPCTIIGSRHPCIAYGLSPDTGTAGACLRKNRPEGLGFHAIGGRRSSTELRVAANRPEGGHRIGRGLEPQRDGVDDDQHGDDHFETAGFDEILECGHGPCSEPPRVCRRLQLPNRMEP